MQTRASTIAAVSVVALTAWIKALNPQIGHLNLLFEPHPITIALNPEDDFPWVAALRREIPTIRAEVLQNAHRAMQPHESYLSKELTLGVDIPSNGTTERPPWDWGILRAGTVDTCLAEFFPRTMSAIQGALSSEDGQRVHTASFSRLGVGRTLPPHCGETHGMFRIILTVDGPKDGVVARQTVLNDHNACLDRFAKPCPSELASLDDDGIAVKITSVEYGVGDAIVLNDFLCHWVEYVGDSPRIALILNVERTDVPLWRRYLLLAFSKLFIRIKGGTINEAAQNACRRWE